MKRKLLSWLLAAAMMVGMVPAAFAAPAAAASAGGSITEDEANALLAGAGTSLVEIALENHYTDYDTVNGQGGSGHMQGICVDDKLEYMYFSYTDALVKVDIATGEVVGSVGGFGKGSFGTSGGAHLGCLEYYDGWVYGSLEYKSPGAKFFVCAIDTSMITEKGMDMKDDAIFGNGGVNGILLKEPTEDFRDPLNYGVEQATNNTNNGHRFGCSGIDGITVGTMPGDDSGELYLILVYGIYGAYANRYDDRYNVLQFYKLSDFWDSENKKPVGTQNIRFTYERGLSQDYTEEEVLVAADTLYVWTGNTEWGSQNLEYEWDTGDIVLYTYGSKENWGLSSMYVVDGSKAPEMMELEVGQSSASANADAKERAELYKVDGEYPVVKHAVLKCVCGDPSKHAAETVGDAEWGDSGIKKADRPICSIGIPATSTYGVHWLGADPENDAVDYFYIANGSYTAGLYKRTTAASGKMTFSKVVIQAPLEEEPLNSEPVMHWTMDAADMDFENGTIVNAVNGETFGGLFENVQVGKGMDGKDGGSLYFDGDADVLEYSRVWMDEDGIADLQAMVDGSDKITVSFWYKPEEEGNSNFTSTWSPILGIYSDKRTVQPGQFVLVAEDRSGELRMCMNNYPNNSKDLRSKGTTAHKNDGWHHIVMTVDLTKNYDMSSTISWPSSGATSLYREFYLDGVRIGQDRALNPNNKETTFDLLTDFEIGGAPYKCWSDSNVRGRFSGWIDDVRIYNTSVNDKQAAYLLQHTDKTQDFDMSTLPEEEVVEITATNTFSKAAPADVVIDAGAAVTSVTADNLAEADYVIDGNTVTISADYLMNRQPGVLTVKVNGADVKVNIIGTVNPILWYDGTVTDKSGYGIDAEVVNAAGTGDQFTFQGYHETIVDRIQVANTDYIDKAIGDEATIVFDFSSNWLVGNITNLIGLYDDARPGMVAQFRDTGGERSGKGTSNTVQFAGQVFTKSSKAWDGNVVGTAADYSKLDGKTHKVAVVYDGSKLAYYLDGALVKEGDVADGAMNGVSALVMGGPVNRTYATSGNSQRLMTNLTGTLDNVAVYAAALTAEEVADIYTNGISIKSYLDVSGLEALVAKVKALAETDYTATSFAALAAPLAAAEAALADTALTQAGLDEASAALLAAYNALVDRADTAALEAAIAAAEALTEADYTADSWAALEAILADAAAVIENADAVQADADEAQAAVEAAVAALVDRADTAALETAIAAAEALTEADYTADSWAALEAVLAEVAAVITDPNAVQADADEAQAAVEAAVAALIDVTELKAAVEEAAALEKGKYTGTSWAAIPDALAAAEAVLADADATAEEIAAAVAALDEAVAALKVAPKKEEAVVISAITVEAGEGGTAKADYLNAPAGTEVTVIATPDEGKKVASITVNGKAIEGTTFKMPAEAVTVVVTFADAGEHICPSEKFDDVDTSLWYHNAIDYVVANGLMAGVADDAFAPNATTTRGMIVTILWALEGKPAATGDAFADVAEGDWYFDAVNWAAANGIVAGYGDDKFGPNDNVTREQLVAILKAYAEYKGADVSAAADLAAYADADEISAWAEAAVAWGVEAGIISGKSADTLDPTGNALRCEVAQMMMKFVAG